MGRQTIRLAIGLAILPVVVLAAEPEANAPDETPKTHFHFADETFRNVGAAVNGRFLGGMETLVFDPHRLDDRISIDFAAADHVEASIRISQALGLGFFNDQPVRHFWISNHALPLLGWQRVEDRWLVLSGDRKKINLTLTWSIKVNQTEPRQPAAEFSLRVDQAPHAGTSAIWEDGATCKVLSSMMSFPTPPGEKITITGTVEVTRPDPKTGSASQARIPFRFQDIAPPDKPLPPPVPETPSPSKGSTIDEF